MRGGAAEGERGRDSLRLPDPWDWEGREGWKGGDKETSGGDAHVRSSRESVLPGGASSAGYSWSLVVEVQGWTARASGPA